MRRSIRIILPIILLAAGAAALWRWRLAMENANHAIRGSGMIEVTEVDVAFEVPGTIVERYADEGALLDKGEPIARLDDREYRLHVERATAARNAAAARYRLVLKGPRGQEIDEALAALEAADSVLENQRRDFERVKSLYDSHVVSRAEFDHVLTARAAAQAQRDAARARVDMLKEGFRTEDIETARAQLHETEKALEIAQLNLSRCQLFAPIAGRVLSKNREVGETVPAGASIVTIGDLTRPWLNLYIGERDL